MHDAGVGRFFFGWSWALLEASVRRHFKIGAHSAGAALRLRPDFCGPSMKFKVLLRKSEKGRGAGARGPVCPFSVRSHPSLGLFVFFLSTQQHVVFTPSSEEKGRSRRGKHEADKARQRRTHALSSEPLNPEGLPGSRPEAGHWWGDCPASGGRGWRYKRESTGRPRGGGYRDADGSMTEVHPARLHAGRAAQGLVARRGRREATPRAPMFYYNAKQKHTKLRRLALSMPPRACHDCLGGA